MKPDIGDPQFGVEPERESLDAQAPEDESLRFLVEITDRRTGHSMSIQSSAAFTAIDKLRATLARPELVMSPKPIDPEDIHDAWGGDA